MANGIDVYVAYQNVRDWSAVKRAGYDFCYVKAGDGVSTRATNGYGPRGRAAGLAMGAYWYAQPGDPVRQANLLCDRALSEGLGDLAPALDIESPFVPGTAATNFAVAFCRQVAARGFRPALYANNSMMNAVLGPVLNAVPNTIVWVARYGANPTVRYDVWQWSDKGSVPGIQASAVDLNRGDIPYNLVAAPGPAPAPTPAPTNNLLLLEESMIRLDPGTNLNVTIPVAGRYPNLWISNGYGAKIQIHQITPKRRTDDVRGNYGERGWQEKPGQPWPWDADKPGPYFLGLDGVADVTIRYSILDGNRNWVAWVG